MNFSTLLTSINSLTVADFTLDDKSLTAKLISGLDVHASQFSWPRVDLNFFTSSAISVRFFVTFVRSGYFDPFNG